MKKNFSCIIPSKQPIFDKNEKLNDINKEINEIKIRNRYLCKVINYDVHNRMISSIFQQNNPYIHPKIIIKPNKIITPSFRNNINSINNNQYINKIDNYPNNIRYNNSYSINNYNKNKIKPINYDKRAIIQNSTNNDQNEKQLPDIYKIHDEKEKESIDFMAQKKHIPHIDSRGAYFKNIFFNENLQNQNSIMYNYNNNIRRLKKGFSGNNSFSKEKEFIPNKCLHQSISYGDYGTNIQTQDYNYIPENYTNTNRNKIYRKGNNYGNNSMININNENIKLPNIY